MVHKPAQPKTKPIANTSTSVNNVHNELNVWYTNSDQFLNNIDELKLRIYNTDTEPSIIDITEVNPKNNRGPINMSELKKDDFWEPLYNPDGRGICISTKYHSQATIALEDNDKLKILCHYRSTSYIHTTIPT